MGLEIAVIAGIARNRKTKVSQRVSLAGPRNEHESITLDPATAAEQIPPVLLASWRKRLLAERTCRDGDSQVEAFR